MDFESVESITADHTGNKIYTTIKIKNYIAFDSSVEVMIKIGHNKRREIISFSVEPAWSNTRFTKGQIVILLSKALEWKKEKERLGKIQEVSEEEKRKFYSIMEKVVANLRFSYKKDQMAFEVNPKNAEKLYLEMKNILMGN
jgi:hypothetical protein